MSETSLGAEVSRADGVLQVATLGVLRDQRDVRTDVGGLEHRQDPGMLQRGQGLALTQHAGNRIAGVRSAIHTLHGNKPRDVGVARQHDVPESPGAEQTNELQTPWKPHVRHGEIQAHRQQRLGLLNSRDETSEIPP